MISEFGQPELQYSRLGDPLHLGLAWLVTEPFGWVFKPILEAEFPDNSEPVLRVGIGGGIDFSCQDSQGVDPSSQSTQLSKNCEDFQVELSLEREAAGQHEHHRGWGRLVKCWAIMFSSLVVSTRLARPER